MVWFYRFSHSKAGTIGGRAGEGAILTVPIEVRRYLENPKTGIKESERQPIIRLLEFAQGKPLGRYWRRKWEEKGRITPEGKVVWDGSSIDLCLMALQWEGFVEVVHEK